MSIKFYNTLSRKKEEFVPLKSGQVKLYTCGPTVYDTAHIGNFRTFIFEDLLKRYLTIKGFNVTHVMNITDVDDKTIERSQSTNIQISKLTDKYTELFFKDIDTLKIIRADHYPKATDHIVIMIDMIQQLVDKGFAYKSDDGSIYFNITEYKDYGKLTKLNFAEQIQSDRIYTDDYSKDNPQDFVLWKSWKAEDGEVFWDSPWGKGRPGWHIECSAMSAEYLGHHFDIHCGGVDNIFPHHENELAQSKCANDSKFVNYWMHSEHLMIDSGKMSKSLDNFYKISELIELDFTPEALRYLLLSGHYRTKIDFSISKKHEALKVVQRINDFYDRLKYFAVDKTSSDQLPSVFNQFIEALDDDLNTPKAFGVFFEWVRNTNLKIDNKSIKDAEISAAINFVEKFNQIFDLLTSGSELPVEVEELIELRNTARSNKNWKKADEYRDKIKELGWLIEDTKDGTKTKLLLSSKD